MVKTPKEKCGLAISFWSCKPLTRNSSKKFWSNAKVLKKNTISSKVLGWEVVLNQLATSKAIGCSSICLCWYGCGSL